MEYGTKRMFPDDFQCVRKYKTQMHFVSSMADMNPSVSSFLPFHSDHKSIRNTAPISILSCSRSRLVWNAFHRKDDSACLLPLVACLATANDKNFEEYENQANEPDFEDPVDKVMMAARRMTKSSKQSRKRAASAGRRKSGRTKENSANLNQSSDSESENTKEQSNTDSSSTPDTVKETTSSSNSKNEANANLDERKAESVESERNPFDLKSSENDSIEFDEDDDVAQEEMDEDDDESTYIASYSDSKDDDDDDDESQDSFGMEDRHGDITTGPYRSEEFDFCQEQVYDTEDQDDDEDSGKRSMFAIDPTNPMDSAGKPDTFLQCPECGAVYIFEREELENDPLYPVTESISLSDSTSSITPNSRPERIVRCSACIHEWFVSQRDLILGDDAAIKALEKSARSPSCVAAQMKSRSSPIALPKPDPMTIFARNLAFRVTEVELREAFGAYGRVVRVEIPCDRFGQSRGFGFIEMADRADGEQAILALNGVVLSGRTIELSVALPRSSVRSISDLQQEMNRSSEDEEFPSLDHNAYEPASDQNNVNESSQFQ